MLSEVIEAIVFIALLISLSPVIGSFIADLVQGNNMNKLGFLKRIENSIYKLGSVVPANDMNWKVYTFSLLIFNFAGLLFLILIQLIQSCLPFNPLGFGNIDLPLAINTAVSFVTNTNWQSYAGETTLSYAVQMIGLTVQNFMSAATGCAVLLALIRGLTRKKGTGLGNFWVDLTRITLYVLLPLSIIFAIFLVSQGVVQTLQPYKEVVTLEGAKQVIPAGPAASQIAIKQLGTNGGGFFNANSAFPFENSTPLSNFFQMLALLLLPASLVFTYGKLIGSKKQAWTIFGVMLFLFVCGLTLSAAAEYWKNPVFGIGGLMEGKETRFGIMNSVIWSTATTAASNGSVNAMHSSLSPIAGLVAIFNIEIGEIIFGGIGSGLYGMLLFIFLTVFISGLMVGRTPEYLGKKIDAYEVKLTIIAIILPNLVILIFTAIALVTQAGVSSLSAAGPHGFSEVLYAFSSAAGNNGSAFAGLNANTNFYNLLIALGMLIGRFGILIPVLAIAGNLVKKNITPASQGTLRTDTFLFSVLLTGIIIIVGALTFFPALSLGPILEHLLMSNGTLF
jgi:potassium-transporting ATPase potassium-binding subunit